MITFDRGEVRFNYRVVGAALHRERVLLHRAEYEDFWSLPGGRGELLEPAADTLRREIREELSAEIEVGRLLWVVESFFEYDGMKYHELALYFDMAFPKGSGIYERQEPFGGTEEGIPLIYEWHRLSELDGIRLFPEFLREGLCSLPSATQHLVHVDEGGDLLELGPMT